MSPAALLKMPGIQRQQQRRHKADLAVEQSFAHKIDKQQGDYPADGAGKTRGEYIKPAKCLERYHKVDVKRTVVGSEGACVKDRPGDTGLVLAGLEQTVCVPGITGFVLI